MTTISAPAWIVQALGADKARAIAAEVYADTRAAGLSRREAVGCAQLALECEAQAALDAQPDATVYMVGNGYELPAAHADEVQRLAKLFADRDTDEDEMLEALEDHELVFKGITTAANLCNAVLAYS